MTKLDSPVTRLTTLTVDGREVEITLGPMDVGRVEPEFIRFRLKGTKAGDKIVPLPLLLRALGWKVKLAEEIRPRVKAAPNEELEQLIQDLERQFGRKETA
jgi:hypothetical protein